MMKNFVLLIAICGIELLSSNVCRAQEVVYESEDNWLEKYRPEAEATADEVLQKFQGAIKPRYQMAYDDYLYDVQIIAETGRAPDNEALYDDLRVMNNNQIFTYETK